MQNILLCYHILTPKPILVVIIVIIADMQIRNSIQGLQTFGLVKPQWLYLHYVVGSLVLATTWFEF